MKNAKKAHVISHSHWDREWYLPYEKHHMLLIEFMDTLMDTLENDPEYKSFHLDGQTIILEDYLQVRPDRRERLTKLIQDGRIVIGPWYILQDEFLTSSEANVRNMQVGHDDAKTYGDVVCKLGYFPDSFGNMGQAPQILQQAGIDTAVFGRGVKPTGFNNEVSGEEFESPYSEMYWESPDGSKVLGVLFANWYSNGNEIPTDAEELKAFWNRKLEDAGKFASTDHLLFLNGCDHQPVQTDLSTALNNAKEFYEDVEFIHSNFNDYITAIKAELPDDLVTVHGELRSQRTDGWFTLANTASARVYLKQMNAKCQTLFEKVAEPVATIAHKLGMEYPHHLFTYGWKVLMQNHPHDSICGCSVDEVHREMVSRFEKAEQVALHIIDEAMAFIKNALDTVSFKNIHEEALPFFVVNPTGHAKSGLAEVTVNLCQMYWRHDYFREAINDARDWEIPAYKIVDEAGNELAGEVISLGLHFDYDLPKDKFRQPYMSQKAKIVVELDKLEAFGLKKLALVPVTEKEENTSSLIVNGDTLENEFLAAKVNDNGSLTITHKATGHVFEEQCIYEDHGDMGNEYIYMCPKEETPVTTKDATATMRIVKDLPHVAVVEVKTVMDIPVSLDALMETEINELISFTTRKTQRVAETTPMEITTTYTLERTARGVKVKTNFNNQALDHRLRALFTTKIDTPFHYADSIFEVAKRNTEVSKEWRNPCNAQHQQNFINVHDENIGLTVANKGLNEYEVLRDGQNTIAVTLHRGMRELGDWGVFLTPEAQCLGAQEAEFMIIPHGAEADLLASYEEAAQFPVPFAAMQANLQEGTIKEVAPFVAPSTDAGLMYSSMKVSKDSGDVAVRYYSVVDRDTTLTLETATSLYRSNLLEEKFEAIDGHSVAVKAYQIVTFGLQA
ncbi:MAG: alpha-mannosidase [Cellulosilyticaceae bacterium]